MLTTDELKTWLHRKLSHRDKLLLILSSFEQPCQIRDIAERGRQAGLKIPTTWNPSSSLGRTGGLAIRTPDGWEITEAGKQHLQNIGVTRLSPAAVQVASDLRGLLLKVKDTVLRDFVEEAVKCYEAKLYRSAVVMSWLAAVHVLHRHVYRTCLAAFNAEAQRVDSRWRPARTPDDLARMKESDFLDRLVALSVLGKNVKDELRVCLDLRNACGHPNSIRVGPNAVARHIEMLLSNVFAVFA